MDKNDNRKHENYELLNMIGYGLAKFDNDFFIQFGFTSKSSFYQYLINIGVSETVGTIKNRQDMYGPSSSIIIEVVGGKKVTNILVENYLLIVYLGMKMLLSFRNCKTLLAERF